jgi:hypothetical protein
MLYWHRLRIILGAAVVHTAICFTAGCAMFQQPSIQIEYPDGRTVQLFGVSGQSHPVKLVDGDLSASTGGVDQALAHLSSSANWLAVGLIIIGLGSIIISTWIPMMPRSMSIICMAAGGIIWAFPLLLDRYSIFVILGISGIGILWIFGMWDNKRKLNVQPKD